MNRALFVLLFSIIAAVFGRPALAQSDLNPIHIIVPFSPGGASDILARIIAPKLSSSLKRTVVVENRPGAGGMIAANYVAKSAGDGATLLVGEAGVVTVSPQLLPSAPYKSSDLTPVANLSMLPMVLAVPANSDLASFKQLIHDAKAKPNVLSIGSSGNGTTPHLTAELTMLEADIKLVHVPYKGSGPAINDTAGGHVGMLFTAVPTVTAQIRGEKLRALAVTSEQRSKFLPNVPTVAELGYPGIVSYISQGVFVSSSTSPDLVKQLNEEINAIMGSAEISSQLEKMDFEPKLLTAMEYAAVISQQTELWSGVMRKANLKVD